MRFALHVFFMVCFLNNDIYAQDRIETVLNREDGAKIPALLSSNWYPIGCGPTQTCVNGDRHQGRWIGW